MEMRDGRLVGLLTGVQWPETHADAVQLAVLVDAATDPALPFTHATYMTCRCDQPTRQVLLALIQRYVSRTATEDDVPYYAWIAACRHRDALAAGTQEPFRPARVEPKQLSLFGGL